MNLRVALICGVLLIVTLVLPALSMSMPKTISVGGAHMTPLYNMASTVVSAVTPHKPAVFVDTFDTVYALREARSVRESENPQWWVSSGAYFYSTGQYGRTIVGALPDQDPRRLRYEDTNPSDTDQGYHPQNIFRLVQSGTWNDLNQEVDFMILGDHLSESPFRNSSNGVLFFNRYQDEFNLYYTGIRVDGYVTIKKKVDNVYYTLAHDPFLTSSSYDRESNPNLLPKYTWIGLRSEVVTNDNNTVTIRLYVDIGKTGKWVLATEAVDDGATYGGKVHEAGHTGIRTDFMDVQFDNYRVEELY